MSTHRARFSPRSTRALTLIEVMIASLVLTLVMVSSLNVLIQNRKVTETSIFQNAAMTVIQGYMEQIKEAKFSTVPYYKDGVLVPANTDDPIQGLASENRTKAIKTYLNNTDVDTMGNEEGETIIDYLLISSGTPIAATAVVPGGATPNGVIDNHKVIDVNQTGDEADDLQLRIWVWVDDISAPTVDATQVRSIKLIYQWKMTSNPTARWYVGSARTMRSSVPTL
jgi:Tfp pilus assembly protein PilV